MSANNAIYVQKRGGRWWVWMGFPNEGDEPKPARCDAKFYHEADAVAYAKNWVENEAVVEYGIIRLPEKG